MITAADVHRTCEELLYATREKREANPVIHPGRVDVIAAGSLVLSAIVAYSGVPEILVSEHDILDGIARPSPEVVWASRLRRHHVHRVISGTFRSRLPGRGLWTARRRRSMAEQVTFSSNGGSCGGLFAAGVRPWPGSSGHPGVVGAGSAHRAIWSTGLRPTDSWRWRRIFSTESRPASPTKACA